MGAINLIVSVIILIVGLIAVIGYYQDKGDMKRTQSDILENLTPERMLTQKEADQLKKLYKINVDHKTPVYSLTGSVGYIVFETNGQGQKEWLIADVLIANRSTKIIEKKGISLEKQIYKEEEIQAKIDPINEDLNNDKITVDEAKERANSILEPYTNNTIEFVIANPSKKEKPVHVLSYKDNEMTMPLNLLS